MFLPAVCKPVYLNQIFNQTKGEFVQHLFVTKYVLIYY